MSEPTSNSSQRHSIVIALIGALATIGAAVIGVAANSNSSRADQDKPSAPATKEERRPLTSPALDNKTPVLSPALLVRAQPPAIVAAERKRLAVGYRKASLPGHGVVLGLTNATEKETLKNVVVSVKSPTDQGERSYKVARALRPGETLSVGWKELDGWKLNSGDVVKIKMDGQATPLEVVVPRL